MAQETIKQHRRYLSYLLRLWQANSDDPPLWWASLENPQDGDRLGFASLDELLAFLRRQIAEEEEVEDRTKDCKKQQPDSGI